MPLSSNQLATPSTYTFFSINVARLLKNSSENKSKIDFLNDLTDQY